MATEAIYNLAPPFLVLGANKVQRVNGLKNFFSKAKQQARHHLKPFVNEMEHISLQHAHGNIDAKEALHKYRVACSKVGVDPSVVDGSVFEAQSLNMFNGADFDASKPGKQKPNIDLDFKGFDFNKNKTGHQSKPVLGFGFKGIDFSKKAGKQSRPDIDLDFGLNFKAANRKTGKALLPEFKFDLDKTVARRANKNPGLDFGFKPINFFSEKKTSWKKTVLPKSQKLDLFNGPNGFVLGPSGPNKPRTRKGRGLPNIKISFPNLFGGRK